MQKANIVTAQTMGMALRFDPQFSMPQRPRFLAEISAIPIANGLVLDGADEQHVLRGRAVESLLPRLIPLLDGQRDLGSIQTSLSDVPAEAITNAISLLYTRGVLEDCVTSAGGVTESTPEALAFFRRYHDSTRANRNGLQAAARLRRAHVIVQAGGPHAALLRGQIAKQLSDGGVGKVTTAEIGAPPAFDDLPATPDKPDEAFSQLLIVALDGDASHDVLRALDDACSHLGVPWLRGAVMTDAPVVEMGPYFERGETCCYDCFVRSRASTSSSFASDADAANATGREDAALRCRWCADMLALEAVYLIGRVAAPLGKNTRRYDLDSGQVAHATYPKWSGCARCRPLRGLYSDDPHPFITLGLAYEGAVALPSRHLIDPKSHQVHYKASNIELANDGKRYPSCEQIALPDAARFARPEGSVLSALGFTEWEPPPAEALNLPRLSSLLMMSAGVRDETVAPSRRKPQRWAATGGNLGSPELYVIARSVQGLMPGAYFYQPHEHTLAKFRSFTQAETAAIIRHVAAGLRYEPQALIVFTGAYHRVGSKYGPFGYRVAHLDCGVAMSQLLLIARGLRLCAQPVEDWSPEATAQMLDLLDLAEIPVGLVSIR